MRNPAPAVPSHGEAPGTDRVEVEHDGGIAVLRLNRPDVLNAIDQAMWLALLDALRTVAADPAVRACLLTGNGRGFCSGADLRESAWREETPDQSRARIDGRNQQVAREMVGLEVPVIACINGYALGGGLEIALAADIRIASRTATMGFPEAAIGRFVTGGASLLLPRAVGLSWAKRLLCTSEHIDAERALAIGLVDEVVEPADLMPHAFDVAGQIAACTPASVSLMKRTVNRLGLADLETALGLETDALVSMYSQSAIDKAQEAFTGRRRS